MQIHLTRSLLQDLFQDLCLKGASRAMLVDRLKEHLEKGDSLRLSPNMMNNSFFVTLIEALKTNTTLTALHLRGIPKEGALAIAECLKSNDTLTWLDISHNKIGDDGCIAIASALKINTTLQKLNIHDNFIGREGYDAIINVLKEHNTTLKEISVSAEIDADQWSEMAYYLGLNESGKGILQSETATTKELVEALIQNRYRRVELSFGLLLLRPDLCQSVCTNYQVFQGSTEQNKKNKVELQLISWTYKFAKRMKLKISER